MSIDITQFHQTFYEESFEGLEIMEAGLLGLDLTAPDDEEINSIFRAAHSIKGGGGSFGFEEVANFTHALETLLDEVRCGDRKLDEGGRSLLLSSVDCLSSMLTQQQDGEELDMGPVVETQDQLSALLGEPQSDRVAPEVAAPTSSSDGWQIKFVPSLDLYRTGNDPARMFRELEHLGSLSAKVDIGNLPDFANIDPEECYLSWDLVVEGEVAEEDVREVFDWVADDSDLEYQPIQSAQPEVPSAPSEPQPDAPAAKPPVSSSTEKPAASPKGNAGGGSKGKSTNTGSIRVGIDKVDSLINMVGELVITQAMLSEMGESIANGDSDQMRDGLEQLERNTRELQESVMQIRMLPIAFSFNRFPRLVHDVSAKLGKIVDLRILGENTELDKTVLEKIGDPMVHLVRNSLDHGLETPEERVAAGKPETGVLELNAFHQGGNIVIKITDDGRGLNTDKIRSKAIEKGIILEEDELSEQQVHDLIFRAGFSTADEVSDLSGRGVGMDVVIRNIKDLGGNVEVRSKEGAGATFTVRLPLTLAILDGQLVRIGKQVYIIPLISIIESQQIDPSRVSAITGTGELYQLREEYAPIIRLYRVFNIEPDYQDLDEGILVIAEGDGHQAGLYVDELLGQQQVVIKSLETNYAPVTGFSGATILGNGQVALILDIAGLIGLAHQDTSGEQPLMSEQEVA